MLKDEKTKSVTSAKLKRFASRREDKVRFRKAAEEDGSAVSVKR